jgi:thimet oligopeptidase
MRVTTSTGGAAAFPTDASVRFAIRIASDVQPFVEADVPRWHPTSVTMSLTSARIAARPLRWCLPDLYPRGKCSHAAAPTYPASTLAQRRPLGDDGQFQSPRPERVNCARCYEFSHVLHGVLSATKPRGGRYFGQRDFVERHRRCSRSGAPTRRCPAADVCPQCPRLTDGQIQRIEDARRFGRGVHYSGQWQYATFDMRLYQGAPKKSLDTWIEL